MSFATRLSSSFTPTGATAVGVGAELETRIEALVMQLLGSHVRGRTANRVTRRPRDAKAREAEVDEDEALPLASFDDDRVRRFDVGMDQIDSVGRAQSLRSASSGAAAVGAVWCWSGGLTYFFTAAAVPPTASCVKRNSNLAS